MSARAPTGQPCAAAVRNWRERALQTIAYEVIGLLVFAPLWVLVAGATAIESITLLASLSIAVMAWMAAYNTIFDVVESWMAGYIASDRPHRCRIAHAVGLETTSVAVTCPLVVWVGGFGWLEALAAEIGLTVAYSVYGYAFHLGFDRLRPVTRPAPSAVLVVPPRHRR